MAHRNATGPYPGSTVNRPFEDVCCWPSCHSNLGEVSAPLCHRHLTIAFRMYRNSHLFALEHKPDYLLREPLERAGIKVPPPVRQTPGVVYFLRFRDRVKIGFSTDVVRRMTEVPHEEILGTVPGTMEDEQRCHAAFAHLREQGEWFRAEPDLLAFIADVAGW